MRLFRPISNGVAIFDLEDMTLFPEGITRAAKGYLKCRKTKKPVHRVIMSEEGTKVVDHINGNKLDNRRSNLRVCSIKQNVRNAKKRKSKNQKSKYKGVSINSSGKYYARIIVDYKSYYLGQYTSEEEAARAYDAAASRYFGDFSRRNFNE